MTTTLSTFPEINVSDIPVHIFFGGQPCIIWPKQPKDPKKQHHLALT